MERTNAIHVTLAEKVALVTIDVAWTKQRIILPSARRLLAHDGAVITLIKPHYEADPSLLRKGILPDERFDKVLDAVKTEIRKAFEVVQITRSPILGSGGNAEALAWLRPLPILPP
jgi:23S rRNA (cytidine1920-2'-O)/16S rRNA (cytidine1409-2'-O)-methyltransferase